MESDNLSKRIEELETELSIARSELAKAGNIRDFIESSAELIFETDSKGRFTHANANALRTLELSLDDILGKTPMDLMLPEFSRNLGHIIYDYIKSKREFRSVESGYYAKDGRIVWLDISGRPMLALNGDLKGYLIKGSDISYKKVIENKLFASEERWRYALEGSGDGVWDWDIPAGKVYYSRRWKDLIGYQEYELEDKIETWKSRVHPDDLPFVWAEIEKHIKGETAAFAGDHRIRCRDGSYKWFWARGRVIQYNERGEAERIIGTISDISENRRMVDDLSRYRFILENTSEEFFLIAADGRIIMANEAAARSLGYTLKEFKGKLISEIDPFFRQEKLADQFKKISRDKYAVIETEQVSKTGQRLIKEIRMLAIDFEGENMLGAFSRDVTQRYQAMNALRESEERYRVLIEHLPDTILIHDGRKIIFANSTGTQMTGYEPDEFIGSDLFKYIHKDSQEIVRFMIDSRQRNLVVPEFYEIKLIKKDTSLLDLEVRAAVVEIDKQPLFLVVLTDITERKIMERELLKEEESLRENERRFRSYFELPLIGLCISDNRGIITNLNAEFACILGNDKKEIYRKNWISIFSENEQLRAQTILDELITGKSDSYLFESALTKKNGDRIFANIAMRAVRKDDGSLDYLMNVIQDITEKKLSEIHLAEEKERLSVTLKSIRDGVITIDASMRTVLMNNVAENLTGNSFVFSVGKQIADIFRISDDTNMKSLTGSAELIAEIKDSEKNWILNAADGKKTPIECSASAIFDPVSKVTGYVIVFRDITEKKKHEENTIKTIKLESLGILAGGIAHDFNNILTTVIGNLSLARMWKSEDPKIAKAVLDAEKASLKAKDLTHQLLTLSKGGLPVKETASAYIIIMDSIDLALHGSAITCDLDIADSIWNLEIDPGQIGQVLHNIMLNSRQAMNDRGIISINCRNIDNSDRSMIHLKSGKFVAIQISDNGPGIPSEVLPKIFDPYFTTKKSGHGLGLAISYSIVKNHGGFIDVASSDDAGTSFTVYLPATTEKVKEHREKKFHSLRSNLRILVLEDEENISALLENIFSKYQINATFTKDGEETVKQYYQSLETHIPYDLVILDLTIPGGMGGKDTIIRLREINPDIKAIVSSGYSNDDAMSNFRKYGFSARVTKPYSVEQLIEAISELTSLPR